MNRAFDAVYDRYKHEILGICMGAVDARTKAVKCYGKISAGSTRRPTPRTLFQIGSISKTLTATLLALRVKRGAVRVTDPIRRYIPLADGSARVPESMTILDLAQHYSGLPRTPPMMDVSSLDHYFAEVAQCESTPECRLAPPGSSYAYSNFAYGVLGEAIARQDGYSDSSYSAWEKDAYAAITLPLGMRDTRSWFGWRASSPARFDALRAEATVGDPPQQPSPAYFPPAPYGDAAAGLYSSSLDMIKWLSYSMGLSGTSSLSAARPLLYDSPELIRSRSRETPANPHKQIGLAWDIDVYGSGRARTTCISKDGVARGFAANMVFVKHRRRGAFVLLNSRPQQPSTPAIAADLINSLPRDPGSPRPNETCGVFEP